MDLIIDRALIPQKEWKWNENEIGCEGVNTFDGCLKWFTYRKEHGGNTLTVQQSYEDFMRDGPLKDSIPADIMLEMYDDIMSALS
ncbi:MAG TPA: hypothetical protein VGK25_10965 [Ignavibacteria bacterium]